MEAGWAPADDINVWSYGLSVNDPMVKPVNLTQRSQRRGERRDIMVREPEALTGKPGVKLIVGNSYTVPNGTKLSYVCMRQATGNAVLEQH